MRGTHNDLIKPRFNDTRLVNYARPTIVIVLAVVSTVVVIIVVVVVVWLEKIYCSECKNILKGSFCRRHRRRRKSKNEK